MQEVEDRRMAMGAHLNARLARAKRIPPFSQMWNPNGDEARVLTKDEAEQQRKRHEALVGRLVPTKQE